jgi:hypothetical protein
MCSVAKQAPSPAFACARAHFRLARCPTAPLRSEHLHLSAHPLVELTGGAAQGREPEERRRAGRRDGRGVRVVANPAQETRDALRGREQRADGPASGVQSVDIGKSETSLSPVGQSLGLTGNGKKYSDFAWSGPATATPGQPNGGQTF